jgi:hypothetical protein
LFLEQLRIEKNSKIIRAILRPKAAVPRARLTGAFGGAMIRAVRAGN